MHTPRSTLASISGQAGAALEPLFDVHKRFVLGCRVLHADETPMALLDPGAGKTRRAYMWRQGWRCNELALLIEFVSADECLLLAADSIGRCNGLAEHLGLLGPRLPQTFGPPEGRSKSRHAGIEQLIVRAWV